MRDLLLANSGFGGGDAMSLDGGPAGLIPASRALQDPSSR